MKVLFRNNDGGGFARRVVVAEGTSIGEFVAGLLPPGRTPDQYTISVNGQVVARADELHEDDAVVVRALRLEDAIPVRADGEESRVSLAPCKVDGA